MRAHVGKCLRDWYAVGEPDHKQCALAAMLATGSDDFSDILVPLLTDPDRQVRVATYQAGEAFYPESLGTDWRRVVDGWDEESRADFVYEVIHRGLMADIGESLAIADPSEKVRAQAIEALSWIGATEALTRVVNALDDAALETALPAFIPDSIPSALRGRVVAANRRLLAREVDPLARIRHLLQAVEFDDADTAVEMMVELKRLPAPPLDQYADHAIDQAIKIVRQGHPQWASDWLAARLLAGTMWGDQWQTSLLAAPRQQVDELIDRLATQEIQPREASAIRTILSASVTLALARQVFDRLCEVQRAISSGGPAGNPAWIWFDQLRSLFRALPADCLPKSRLPDCRNPFRANSIQNNSEPQFRFWAASAPTPPNYALRYPTSCGNHCADTLRTVSRKSSLTPHSMMPTGRMRRLRWEESAMPKTSPICAG